MKRLLLAAFCAAAVSACGGGGGGGGGTAAVPSTPSTPAATPTPTAAPIQTTSVQRAVAGQTLTSYIGTQRAAGLGGVGGTALASVRRQIDASAVRVTAGYRGGARATAGSARRAQSVTYSACSNGLESATVVVSAVEEQIYERMFYDSLCAHLHEDMMLDVVATSATAGSATGNVTLYNLSGTVFAYETLQMTLTGIGTTAGTVSLIVTDAPSASSPVVATVGVACSVSTGALGCGVGGVTRESGLGQDLGATVGFTVTVPAATGGSVTVPVTGNASSYSGSLGTLSLVSGTFPNFAVSGGTLTDSGTFSGSFTYATGTLSAASFTLTDAASDGTASITASGTPAVVTGVVKRTSTGAALATFTADAAGNGTVTYGNGTTGQIVDWQVLG